MREDGSFLLSVDQQQELQGIWQSPVSKTMLEDMWRQYEKLLLARLRRCPETEVDRVRAQLDMLDEFWITIAKTAQVDMEGSGAWTDSSVPS